ncbi:MAG: RdgB/HAM1 family non-canonical purine NTP pyrophosphatase [Clostridiales bacterium]|jgi:XTP/dITP diphosphohydrolase|nr:RdgB/HAM1 family non-canonical purine NTP pyrophosphatase [Clostridiales bacterium]
MKKKIIFATSNEDKMKEIRMIMADLDYEIISLKEAGITVDIIEDGSSFEENALIKARTVMAVTNEIVMADDSGLEIDAFDKKPGIHSSRFLGEDTPYDIKNRYILDKLKDVEWDDRTARFVCAIACVFPDGRVITKEGVMEGHIGYEIEGENGFGYDPIFWLAEYNTTSASLTPDQKNKESHRGKALEAIKEELVNL